MQKKPLLSRPFPSFPCTKFPFPPRSTSPQCRQNDDDHLEVRAPCRCRMIHRGLTATARSSFIWLGVVAAFVVFGLTLFLCRARLGAYRRIPPGLLPMEEQARPVLWEAYVSLEELEGGFMRSQEEKSTQECTDVLVCCESSLCISGADELSRF